MIEKARVLRVEDDRVALACDDSACGACPASKVFCRPGTREFTAENVSNISLAPNQMVDVYIHPGKAIWAGFTVLMMPLVLFALGYFAGDAVIGAGVAGSGREVLNVLVGLAGLGIGFGVAFLYHRSRRGKDLPQVVGVSRIQPILETVGPAAGAGPVTGVGSAGGGAAARGGEAGGSPRGGPVPDGEPGADGREGAKPGADGRPGTASEPGESEWASRVEKAYRGLGGAARR